MTKKKPKKIRVIGGAGCGKSTFSKMVTKHTGYRLISLDHLDHRKNRGYDIEKDLGKQLGSKHWIVEGVQYSPLYEKTMTKADVVIFIDYSLPFRQVMLVKRYVQLKLHLVDSKRKCNFSQLIRLMKWNKQFEHDRIGLEQILRQSHVKVIRVKNRKELLSWYDKHLK